VEKLSGGNQQKVMLSKWLNAQPRLLILDEPTRGIDVGAKAEVHHMIDDLAAQGLGVILISSDLPEVLAMSDRVLVMREGRQMGSFKKADARPEQIRELVLVLIIILTILFFGTQIENYYNARFFNRVSTSVAIIAVIAVGQTLVVLTRNIDLSVGSIVGFTAYFVGQLLADNNEIAPLVAVLMCIGLGAVMGAFNGLLVSYGRVPAIIVTLGTLALYRTILVEYSDAQTVLTANLPAWLLDLPRANIFSLSGLDLRVLVGGMLLVVLIFHLILRYLPFGRRLYAIGSNPEAARVAGFPSQRIVFLAFVLCGALAGLAGFMFLARFGNITVVAGLGLELASVAAVVVGGVNIFGGSGTVIGALLGAILINLLENSLIRLPAISEFWRDALLGLLILLAVAVDSVIMSRLRDLWAHRALEEDAQDRFEIESKESGYVA
jgi:rhamnose transport system permease protein